MPPSPETSMILRVMDTHIEALRDEMQKMREASENRHVEIMQLIEGAFPDGDLKSHYQYHMRLIEEAQARKAIRLEIWKKVLSGSIWSILAFLGFKLVEWARDHVRF